MLVAEMGPDQENRVRTGERGPAISVTSGKKRKGTL